MKPKFVTLPDINIAGYSIKTTTADGENFAKIPDFWGDYLTDGNQNKLHNSEFVKCHSEYGACFSENGEMLYVIGVEVKDNVEISKEFYTCTIPAATYAVFSTPHSKPQEFGKNIQETWKYIFYEWLPSSEYEYAQNCVDFEHYTEECMSEKGMTCDIYIPIIEKK